VAGGNVTANGGAAAPVKIRTSDDPLKRKVMFILSGVSGEQPLGPPLGRAVPEGLGDGQGGFGDPPPGGETG